jgi:hypothetical protein
LRVVAGGVGLQRQRDAGHQALSHRTWPVTSIIEITGAVAEYRKNPLVLDLAVFEATTRWIHEHTVDPEHRRRSALICGTCFDV